MARYQRVFDGVWRVCGAQPQGLVAKLISWGAKRSRLAVMFSGTWMATREAFAVEFSFFFFSRHAVFIRVIALYPKKGLAFMISPVWAGGRKARTLRILFEENGTFAPSRRGSRLCANARAMHRFFLSSSQFVPPEKIKIAHAVRDVSEWNKGLRTNSTLSCVLYTFWFRFISRWVCWLSIKSKRADLLSRYLIRPQSIRIAAFLNIIYVDLLAPTKVGGYFCSS